MNHIPRPGGPEDSPNSVISMYRERDFPLADLMSSGTLVQFEPVLTIEKITPSHPLQIGGSTAQGRVREIFYRKCSLLGLLGLSEYQ